MLLYENLDIPYVEKTIKEYRVELDKSLKATKYWRRLSIVFISSSILLVLLTTVLSFVTRSGWLCNVLSVCTVISSVFMFVFIGRWDHWEEVSKTWARFLRPMEMALGHAREVQNGIDSEI